MRATFIVWLCVAAALAAGCIEETPDPGAAIESDSGPTEPDMGVTDAQDAPIVEVLPWEDAADALDVEATEPDVPEISIPDMPDPDVPDLTEPDVPEPDTAEPDTAEPDTAEPDVPAVDPATLPCELPLIVTPQEAFILPFELLTFAVEGGTGQYRFELTDDQSGALLNDLSGAYLSGPNAPLVDSISVTDLGCADVVAVTVDVVLPMLAAPSHVTLQSGTSFQYLILGGSGQTTGAVVTPTPLGTLDDSLTYTAGDTLGVDVIAVTDLGTGEVREVTVEIVKDTAIKPVPAVLLVPVNALFKPVFEGGSGHFDLVGDPAIADGTAGIIQGVSEGTTTMTVTDQFTGEQTTLHVTVAPSLSAQFIRAGDQSVDARMATPGDIDGDGFVDFVLGYWETDLTAVDAGAVYIYRGTEDGIEPDPVRVLVGQTRRERFGSSLATGDFDGDGLVDLAVGAWLADVGVNDTGAVFIY
ncbi:MAG: hypothetical protein ACI9WU_005310, partial [Myxococcota bacterium]